MVNKLLRYSLLALALLAVLPLAAQNAADNGGAGVVHFVNSGSPQAQAAFLRGLALLHDFEYQDAASSFRQAEQIDPNFAMAYWGEAMTFNHPVWMQQDLDAARAALQKLGPTPAARLAKAPTEREKDYLRALDILYGEGSKEERDFNYADAMAALHARYPGDVDAAAFYALSLLGTAHQGRDFAIYMRAAAVLLPLFYQHPTHPGLAHYLIHSFDDPIHAPLGLDMARAYSKIAPGAAHAQHMTSHIFVALGMWDDVVRANETAIAVVDRARAARRQPPSVCGHYNFWLEYGYLQQGRPEAALRLLEQCRAAAEKHVTRGGPDPDDSLIGSYAVMRTRYLLDSQQWSGEVAGWSLPEGVHPVIQATFAFGTGFAALQRGDLQTAQAALDQLHEARIELEGEAAAEAAPGSRQHRRPDLRTSTRAQILEEQLQAVLLAHHGKGEQAVALLRQAAESEASLPFEFGPPFIDKPTPELLGELLLELHRPDEAKAAFQQALARAPGRKLALDGEAEAARLSGESSPPAQ